MIAGFDGKFSIEVASKDAILVFSHIGYKAQEAVVKADLQITMQPDVAELSGVVVTALGIKREEKSLTYNVQQVKSSELVKVRDASFMNSLTAKVAGVMINTSSIGVGGAARVVMRGTKSIAGNNNALYVIDGIPMPQLNATQPSDLYTGMGQSGDGIAAISSDDIESVSVLTGAAAALYGSDAANGVVVITTKKGEVQKLVVSVYNSTTFSSPFVIP